jgi:hypothetical protein
MAIRAQKSKHTRKNRLDGIEPGSFQEDHACPDRFMRKYAKAVAEQGAWKNQNTSTKRRSVWTVGLTYWIRA